MQRKLLCLVAIIGMWVAAVMAQAPELEIVQINGANLVVVPGEIDPNIVPRVDQPWEETLADYIQEGATPGVLYPWNARPDMFGFNPGPSAGAYFASEFWSNLGIILGWPSYVFNGAGQLTITELREIVRHAVGRMWVTILAPNATTRTRIINTLNAIGIDQSQYELITFATAFPDGAGSPTGTTVDTIWIRDYGPEPIWTYDGFFGFVDMSYYPAVWASASNPRGRVRDDSVPKRLADYWGIPHYRPRLAAEGGNLQSDGLGTCFVSDRMRAVNQSLFGYSSQALADVLYEHYGCFQTVILNPLSGEGTGHIDMFMTVVSYDTILVGQYDTAYDAINAARLDQNANTLAGLGYNVVRIPMPRPYTIGGVRVWATFANSININDVTLVPVYRNASFPAALRDTILAQEAQALAAFRNALPGVTVVPVIGDPLIPSGGSLHCINITY